MEMSIEFFTDPEYDVCLVFKRNDSEFRFRYDHDEIREVQYVFRDYAKDRDLLDFNWYHADLLSRKVRIQRENYEMRTANGRLEQIF